MEAEDGGDDDSWEDMHIETEMKKAARRGVRVGGPSLKMQVSKRDAGLWQGSKQAKKENRKEEEFRGGASREAVLQRSRCRDSTQQWKREKREARKTRERRAGASGELSDEVDTMRNTEHRTHIET